MYQLPLMGEIIERRILFILHQVFIQNSQTFEIELALWSGAQGPEPLAINTDYKGLSSPKDKGRIPSRLSVALN